jgi:hypothetical protein
VTAATIGPFAGAVYPGVSTPEGLAARREVNDWIRFTDTFDAVFDVARAVETPKPPTTSILTWTAATACTSTTKAPKPWPTP